MAEVMVVGAGVAGFTVIDFNKISHENIRGKRAASEGVIANHWSMVEVHVRQSSQVRKLLPSVRARVMSTAGSSLGSLYVVGP